MSFHKKKSDSREANQIIAKFNSGPEVLKPLLHEAQQRYSHIPENIIEQLASNLGLPASELYSLTENYNNRWYCDE